MATVSSSKRQLVHTSNTYESTSNLTVGGDLLVSGATTTIDTANLLVEDKNVILGNVSSPSDTTADGGGITLKGASDYTINWLNSNDSWNFNQGIVVGQDGTGYDVTFHSATSGRAMSWDSTARKLNFGDLTSITVGAGDDLTFYHNANSFIESKTNSLIIKNTQADGITYFQADDGSGSSQTQYFRIDGGSGTNVFSKPVHVGVDDTGHDVKFFGATAGRYLLWDESANALTGVYDLKLADSRELQIGGSNDLRLYHSHPHSYIKQGNSSGSLYITSHNSIQLESSGGADMITCSVGGATKLFHNGSQKLETTSSGVTISGLSLELFHSGGNNYISSAASGSHLLIRNTGGANVELLVNTSEKGVIAIPNGAVQLYHDNALKLTTTAGGADVSGTFGTGHINLDGELNFTTNGSKYIDANTLANSNSFNIRHHNPSGNLYETAFQSVANGATTLYYDGGARFATTTDGIQLHGNGYIDLPDNGRARFGQSQDLAIYHTTTGPHSYIDNITGDLFIRNNSNDCVIIGHNANKGLIYCPDGRVELRFNDVKKFETTNDGIKVSHDGNVGALLETDADSDSNFLFFKSASSTRQVYVGAESTAGSNFSGTLAAAAVFGGVSSGQATQIISGGGSTHVKMTVKHDGDVGIATTSPTEKLDVRGTSRIGYTSTNGHLIGSKSYSITQTFSTGLTVTIADHTACHVKVFISGDWSNHSSIAYVGEFFIQNTNNNSSTFNEPGIILTEHDNLPTDGILSKIVDGTSDSFEIQFRANTNSSTSVSGRLCYHVMGDASAVS